MVTVNWVLVSYEIKLLPVGIAVSGNAISLQHFVSDGLVKRYISDICETS